MERRRLLRSSTVIGGGILAGCLSSSEDEDVEDSDGDGVIDSEDYAPQDPDVQDKSDLEEAGSSINDTQTEPDSGDTDTDDSDTDDSDGSESDDSDTRDPDTDSSDTDGSKSDGSDTDDSDTQDSDTDGSDSDSGSDSENDSGTETEGGESSTPANEFKVDDEAFVGDSYFASYSSREVTAVIDPKDPAISNLDLSNYDIQVIAPMFPRESIVADSVDRSSLGNTSKTTIDITIDISGAETDTPIHYMLFLVPSGETIETANASNIHHIHETDPFLLDGEGSTIERATIPELEGLDSDSGTDHERTVKEGVFQLSFQGRTAGENWDATFYTYKSAYVTAVRRDHGRSRPQFVSYEMSNGFARELATLLESKAEQNGFTDKRMQAEFVIDFVQHLPYVPDDVSKGYDDYTKFIMETVTECGGDCEDTSVFLTSVLQAEPFGYDLVLIQPPGHMAAGIKGSEDLPGAYWEYDGSRYYYIETTGVGWDIGDLPDEYKSEKARIHQV